MKKFIKIDNGDYLNLHHVYKFRAKKDGVYSINHQYDPDIDPKWVKIYELDSLEQSRKFLDDLVGGI